MGMDGIALNHGARSALLIEDNMIIALDTEECLRGLGVGNVVTQGTVTAGLAELGQRRFDLAVLDFNLGTETSEPVAQELIRQGIPFWLATGDGAMTDQLGAIGAEGLLLKPYGREELMHLLGCYAQLTTDE